MLSVYCYWSSCVSFSAYVLALNLSFKKQGNSSSSSFILSSGTRMHSFHGRDNFTFLWFHVPGRKKQKLSGDWMDGEKSVFHEMRE